LLNPYHQWITAGPHKHCNRYHPSGSQQR